MNAKNVNEILDALGARFGATGAHLWAVLVRQVYIDALVYGGGALIAIVLTGLLVRRAIAFHTKRTPVNGSYARSEADENDGLGIMLAIASACAVVVSIIILCTALPVVGQLANPEYGALQTILGALHK